MAATTGSNSASGYQLATGDPVMAIGGFNGTDPTPTLAQFEQYVSEGRIHYYVGGGGGVRGRRPRGFGNLDLVADRLLGQPHYTAVTVDGVTALRPHRTDQRLILLTGSAPARAVAVPGHDR